MSIPIVNTEFYLSLDRGGIPALYTYDTFDTLATQQKTSIVFRIIPNLCYCIDSHLLQRYQSKKRNLTQSGPLSGRRHCVISFGFRFRELADTQLFTDSDYPPNFKYLYPRDCDFDVSNCLLRDYSC